MTYNKKKDYCSCSPEKLWGVKFNYACYLHDVQYGGKIPNRKTRKQADQKLREVIIREFSKKGKIKLGYIVGNIYYYAVRIFGRLSWKA